MKGEKIVEKSVQARINKYNEEFDKTVVLAIRIRVFLISLGECEYNSGDEEARGILKRVPALPS